MFNLKTLANCTLANYQIIKAMLKKVDFLNSLKGLNESDLKAKITEDELRMKKLSFAHAISPLENPQSIRSLRRDIARLKTALKKIQAGF